MTAERKASVKLTITMAFSAGSCALLLWVGTTLATINRTLTYSTSVQDISDWQAAIERANHAGIEMPDFWQIWERNHAERKSVIGGMP